MYLADDLLPPTTAIPYIHITTILQLSHYELTRVPCRKCPSVRPFFRGFYVRNCWAGCCEIWLAVLNARCRTNCTCCLYVRYRHDIQIRRRVMQFAQKLQLTDRIATVGRAGVCMTSGTDSYKNDCYVRDTVQTGLYICIYVWS